MRVALDDWHRFCTIAEIQGHLEEVLGKNIEDNYLDGAVSLRDFAEIFKKHLPPDNDTEARSIELVCAAARSVEWYSATDVSLDIPIVEAVDPCRWDDDEWRGERK